MLEHILLLIGLFLIGYGIFKWATINNNYFAERNLPQLKPSFLVGNTGAFFFKKYDAFEFIKTLYSSYPNEKFVQKKKTKQNKNS